LVSLAQGDTEQALSEFHLEIDTAAAASLRVYGAEFRMNAHDGQGFALLASRQFAAGVKAFEQALALFPAHARSHIGVAACWLGAGRKADANTALNRAETSIAELERTGRHLEAVQLTAMLAVVRGRPTDAVALLDRLLTEAPAGFPGWTIPIEPIFKSLQAQPEFGILLARLADRAR
jgi:Flp pilus assembly protein TadD